MAKEKQTLESTLGRIPSEDTKNEISSLSERFKSGAFKAANYVCDGLNKYLKMSAAPVRQGMRYSRSMNRCIRGTNGLGMPVAMASSLMLLVGLLETYLTVKSGNLDALGAGIFGLGAGSAGLLYGTSAFMAQDKTDTNKSIYFDEDEGIYFNANGVFVQEGEIG